MPRVNVYLSDELAATVAELLPGVNFSRVMAEGLRALLRCRHDELACSACGHGESRRAIEELALDRLYSDLLWELGDLVRRVGTAEGAARIVKKVALGHGVPGAQRIPLPRPSRSQRERHRVLELPENRELPAPGKSATSIRERYLA